MTWQAISGRPYIMVSAFIRDANLPKKYLTETLSFFRKQEVKVGRCRLTR